MKKILYLIIFLLSTSVLKAQESTSSFTLLRLPTSSHVAALGGENISIVDDAIAVGWNNPALFANVSDKTVGVNFMSLPDEGIMLGMQFSKAFGERHTAVFGAQMLNYGEQAEIDASGVQVGNFSPKDFVFSAGYSYLLADMLSGGAMLNFVHSRYAEYTSMALSVNLGLNYYDEERDFSASLALKNLGHQVKAFDQETESLPLSLQAGFTVGLAHAPVRFSVTLTDLNHWGNHFYYTRPGEGISFSRKCINHLVLGIDLIPVERFYLSAGFNARRAYELKQAGSAHGAGLSFGGGLRLDRLKIGASWAKYSLSASNILVNLSYSL